MKKLLSVDQYFLGQQMLFFICKKSYRCSTDLCLQARHSCSGFLVVGQRCEHCTRTSCET